MRVFRVEPIPSLSRWKKTIDLFLARKCDRFHKVGEIEPIGKDHHREKHRLGQPEGDDDRIEYFLGFLTIKLKPSSIPLGKAVDVVGS